MPPVEVEFSDKPEIAPLTLTHMTGPFGLVWGLGLGMATVAWLAELCMGMIQKRKDRVTKVTFIP